MISVELTAAVERSALQDGTVRYTAALIEMPGIVAEGETEEGAVAELIGLVKNLHDRHDGAIIGLRTPAVAGWSWQVSAASETETYGAMDTQAGVLAGASAA